MEWSSHLTQSFIFQAMPRDRQSSLAFCYELKLSKSWKLTDSVMHVVDLLVPNIPYHKIPMDQFQEPE